MAVRVSEAGTWKSKAEKHLRSFLFNSFSVTDVFCDIEYVSSPSAPPSVLTFSLIALKKKTDSNLKCQSDMGFNKCFHCLGKDVKAGHEYLDEVLSHTCFAKLQGFVLFCFFISNTSTLSS